MRSISNGEPVPSKPPTPSSDDSICSRAASEVNCTPCSLSLNSSGLEARFSASSSGDQPGLVELEERLVEGLHAVLAGAERDLLADVLGLLLVLDAVPDVRRRDQDLHGGHAALAVGAGHQALAITALRTVASWMRICFWWCGREDRDDAVDRLGGVEGVQGREDQVAGLGGEQRGLDRLVVAHLADQDDVGVLAQRRAQGGGEAAGVDVDLALVDDGLLVAVQELDGVLDGDDVLGARGR